VPGLYYPLGSNSEQKVGARGCGSVGMRALLTSTSAGSEGTMLKPRKTSTALYTVITSRPAAQGRAPLPTPPQLKPGAGTFPSSLSTSRRQRFERPTLWLGATFHRHRVRGAQRLAAELELKRGRRVRPCRDARAPQLPERGGVARQSREQPRPRGRPRPGGGVRREARHLGRRGLVPRGPWTLGPLLHLIQHRNVARAHVG